MGSLTNNLAFDQLLAEVLKAIQAGETDINLITTDEKLQSKTTLTHTVSNVEDVRKAITAAIDNKKVLHVIKPENFSM